jgi:hypothetical protein
MRVSRAAILVAALALLGARAGSAQTFYSTGTNVVGGIDQNWQVSTGYGAWNTLAFVPAHIWPHGAETWISDDNHQYWQWFTFRQYFDLTGYDAASALLSFRWGCDDVPGGMGPGWYEPLLAVNGGAFGEGGTCGGYNIAEGSLVTLTGFRPGENFIDFRVQGNWATNGMGLKVERFSAEPMSTVPEPATVMLFASGLLGLGIVTLVRRKV